jgi:hypothetical protein
MAAASSIEHCLFVLPITVAISHASITWLDCSWVLAAESLKDLRSQVRAMYSNGQA